MKTNERVPCQYHTHMLHEGGMRPHDSHHRFSFRQYWTVRQLQIPHRPWITQASLTQSSYRKACSRCRHGLHMTHVLRSCYARNAIYAPCTMSVWSCILAHMTTCGRRVDDDRPSTSSVLLRPSVAAAWPVGRQKSIASLAKPGLDGVSPSSEAPRTPPLTRLFPSCPDPPRRVRRHTASRCAAAFTACNPHSLSCWWHLVRHAFRADIRDIYTAHTSVEPGERTCGNDRPGGVMMPFIDRLAEVHPEVHLGAEHVPSEKSTLFNSLAASTGSARVERLSFGTGLHRATNDGCSGLCHQTEPQEVLTGLVSSVPVSDPSYHDTIYGSCSCGRLAICEPYLAALNDA
ncbi:hypothetical protein GY45DRAFT_769018 [Cubamyces sp. BRFM 1775]|nr:hypothetical protein GY45DRAFT_769018 [Cubamyces sp. BRFM 1775]